MGFWDIGWGNAHRADEARVQVMQDMAFVPINQHTPTFAPMTHLRIFNANPSVFCDSFDQTLFSFFIHLHILRLHRVSLLRETAEPGARLPVARSAPRSPRLATRSGPR